MEGGEESRGDIRVEMGEVWRFNVGYKLKESKEERQMEESQVEQTCMTNLIVYFCSSRHSILGRSCSSDAGCLNLGNQLIKT